MLEDSSLVELGRLLKKIVHDLNNKLTTVISYHDYILR